MRVGLFVSEASGALRRTLDLTTLLEPFSALATAAILSDLTSADSVERVLRAVRQDGLEGIVLAGESPAYFRYERHADHLLAELRELGLNPAQIAHANLLEQVALVHDRGEPANAKARALIEVAVNQVRGTKPIGHVDVTPRRSVVVFGATSEAILSAAQLLRQGYKVYLWTRNASPVGVAFPDVAAAAGYVERHERARVVAGPVTDFYGRTGDFQIGLPSGRRTRVGGVVAAVGDDEQFVAELHQQLRIDRDERGLFAPTRADVSPVATRTSGIVVIAHETGRDLVATRLHVDAALLELETLLDRPEFRHDLRVASVLDDVCGGCGTCIKTCIFDAAKIDAARRRSWTDTDRCVGCGNCVTACPTGARDQVSNPSTHLFESAEILASAHPTESLRVLYIGCGCCGTPSLDDAGRCGLGYPPTVMPLAVSCGGRVDTQLVLTAFHAGFAGVAVGVCHPDHCGYLVGGTDLGRRLDLFRVVLRSRGIDSERLRILYLNHHDGPRVAAELNEFVAFLAKRRAA